MKTRWALTLFVILATPAALRAAWRVHRSRTLELDVQVRRLRGVTPFASALYQDHENWRRVAFLYSRLLPLLPGGPCYRESLLLLDLWSRCGLSPRLFLGVQKDGENRRFHAWIVTAEGPETSAQGHEVFWEG